jgi:glycosyltransferase involved in cell wall biosynthesis
MKTAIVHDWIPLYGGAERVLSEIYDLFPSTIYTLMVNKNKIVDTPLDNLEIIPSLIQGLPFAHKYYRNYLPLFPYAVEQFDLKDNDLILSSSYAVAKGVMVNSNQLHICYCHTPVRYGWDLYHHYVEESDLRKGLKSLFIKVVLHYLRMWDVNTINRVDHFIANSHNVSMRIKRIYNRPSEVIYPPVDTKRFNLNPNKDTFYLTASRMVPYKKMDLIVEAFANMPDKKLIVIGDGPDYNKIKSKAKCNIEFLGFQPNNVLNDYMGKAKAFVFAAEEDFGIAPVEAQACGTPVIGLGKGGLLETVIPNVTGVFFNNQSIGAIIEAVKIFESKSHLFNPYEIRSHSERFSKETFRLKFNNFVQEKYKDFKSGNKLPQKIEIKF